jgi:hypothetical protein
VWADAGAVGGGGRSPLASPPLSHASSAHPPKEAASTQSARAKELWRIRRAQ